MLIQNANIAFVDVSQTLTRSCSKIYLKSCLRYILFNNLYVVSSAQLAQ